MPRSQPLVSARPRSSAKDADAAGDSLGLRAYETIFSAIQTGKLRPGSCVREAALALSLGMSRTPLREAVKRLQNEGLVTLEAQRGIRIVKLTRHEVMELFTAREWAEGATAALAARHAGDAEIATLHHILALEKAAASDPVAGARYNRSLHATIHDCSRNRYLIEHVRSLNALVALAGDSTRRSAGRYQEALREHTAIVEAIEGRDADRAEQRAREHIRAAQYFVLANLVEDANP